MTPNQEEQIVIDSLRIQGYTRIVFEPDGNIPPDILVDDQIAVEVRRLNQNVLTEDGFQGLEQDDYSVFGLLSRAMKMASDQEYESSAFVNYYFSRPLPPKKEIKKRVLETLRNHKQCIHEEKEYFIGQYMRIRFFPSSTKLQQQFQHGMNSDEDSGGFVVGLIHDNLKMIIEEKEQKVSKYRGKYSEWWLAVVDKFGYGMVDLELEQFNELPQIRSNFDRILVVSSIDPGKFTYLYE